jgi:Immunity protein 31
MAPGGWSYNMKTRFQFYEIVRVIAQPRLIREDLVNKEGIVVGMSDPDNLNYRDYGVHFNHLRETFVISEDLLESSGRVGSRKEVISLTFEEQLKIMQATDKSD